MLLLRTGESLRRRVSADFIEDIFKNYHATFHATGGSTKEPFVVIQLSGCPSYPDG